MSSTYKLFIKLFRKFKQDEKALEYALKWFLNVSDLQEDDENEDNLKNILELDGNI